MLLTHRGLRGVKQVISDAHEGLKAAAAKVLSSTWQRCKVHFMRNALAHAAGKGQRQMVLAMINTCSPRRFNEAGRGLAGRGDKLAVETALAKTGARLYYPGFTIVGLVGEFGGMVALAALLYLTPYGTSRFWWIGAALALLVAAHATYWLMTHPVNNFWVRDVAMAAPGASFFSAFANARAGDWTELRNRWEISHVIIACFATLSLASIAVATSLFPNEAWQ